MKTIEEKKDEVINYFKSAFLVDGEVKIINELDKFKIDAVIELNDSKRGRFYIAKVKSK